MTVRELIEKLSDDDVISQDAEVIVDVEGQKRAPLQCITQLIDDEWTCILHGFDLKKETSLTDELHKEFGKNHDEIVGHLLKVFDLHKE